MSRLVTSSRWQVSLLTIWVVSAIGSFPFASKVNQALDTSARVNGSESAAVEAALQQRFKSQQFWGKSSKLCWSFPQGPAFKTNLVGKLLRFWPGITRAMRGFNTSGR